MTSPKVLVILRARTAASGCMGGSWIPEKVPTRKLPAASFEQGI